MVAKKVMARSLVPSSGVHGSVTVSPGQAFSETMADASVPFITAQKSHTVISVLRHGPRQLQWSPQAQGEGTQTSHLPPNGAVIKLILIRPCGMGYVWMQPSLENTSAILRITNTHRYSYKYIDHSTTCHNNDLNSHQKVPG